MKEIITGLITSACLLLLQYQIVTLRNVLKGVLEVQREQLEREKDAIADSWKRNWKELD